MKSLSIVLLMTCILNTSKGTPSLKTTLPTTTTTATTNAILPVSLACTMEQKKEVATITLEKDGYVLSSEDNRCNSTLTQTGVSKTYKLKEACKDKILHLKRTSARQFETSSDLYNFKVSCQMDAVGIYKADYKALKVGGPSSKTLAATSHPDDRIELHVIETFPSDPVSTINQLKNDITGPAKFGEWLYLTIVGNYNDAVLIPKSCTTKIKSVAEKNIWTMDTTQKKCSKEPAIVKTIFKTGKTTSGNPFSYLKIQAFQFAGHENEEITFSCKVKVCSTGCDEDKQALDACDKTKRRRREVDDSATSKSTIHYVTAKLRVVNDVMVHATDGSSSIAYTLPCLLVSLLARAIL